MIRNRNACRACVDAQLIVQIRPTSLALTSSSRCYDTTIAYSGTVRISLPARSQFQYGTHSRRILARLETRARRRPADFAGCCSSAFKSPERIFGAHATTNSPRPASRVRPRAISATFADFDPIEKELCELPRLGRAAGALDRPGIPGQPAPYRRSAALFLSARRARRPPIPMSIAVVGARAASDAGRRMAQRLGLELAAKGFTVVSGLARGIDSEAHQGALDGARAAPSR